MDVWIVKAGHTVVAVFSSEEKADKFMQEKRSLFPKNLSKFMFTVDRYEV